MNKKKRLFSAAKDAPASAKATAGGETAKPLQTFAFFAAKN